MKQGLCVASILLVLPGMFALRAQDVEKPVITVTSSGKAMAKPDLAVVFLNIKSTAPLAADALGQNSKKDKEVKARLSALGYKDDKVSFSGNRFAPAGGGTGIYYGGQRPTGFDVYNFLLVYLDGPDLKDANSINTRVSTILDEMSKLGAAPYEASQVIRYANLLACLRIKAITP